MEKSELSHLERTLDYALAELHSALSKRFPAHAPRPPPERASDRTVDSLEPERPAQPPSWSRRWLAWSRERGAAVVSAVQKWWRQKIG